MDEIVAAAHVIDGEKHLDVSFDDAGTIYAFLDTEVQSHVIKGVQHSQRLAFLNSQHMGCVIVHKCRYICCNGLCTARTHGISTGVTFVAAF